MAHKTDRPISYLHSVARGVLVNAMKADLERSSGIVPLSYIAFISLVVFSIPRSSKALIISADILSGPVAFPFFIFFGAKVTSSLRMHRPSKVFFILG